jgi:hypothetical protein
MTTEDKHAEHGPAEHEHGPDCGTKPSSMVAMWITSTTATSMPFMAIITTNTMSEVYY